MWLQLKLVLFALTLCLGQKVDPKTAALVSRLNLIGFPQSWVSETLALCLGNQNNSPLQEIQAQLKQIIDSNKELKSEIQNLKSVSQESKFDIKELKCDVKAVMKFNKMSARNCADLLKMGETESGVRTVQMFPQRSCGNRSVPVFCDQTTDGGGWTVIQRRADLPQREDFFRGWLDYQLGFGNLTGEFWLGLDNIHALVNETQMELRVDLEDFEGEKRWAKYDLFHIEDSAGKYRLKLGHYQGDAGDDLSNDNNQQFTTKDSDHDSHSSLNCAEDNRGAWWYNWCTYSNLNGFQHRGPYETRYYNPDGIYWLQFRGYEYSLKSTQMSVRPRLQN